MKSTNTQDLPYPECEDPADGALQLQVLAEAIDAKLVDAFASFRAVVNRSAFIASLTANQAGFSSGAPGSSIIWDAFLFNSAVTSDVGSGIIFYETGYWMVGAFLQSNPSAGITANSNVNAVLQYQGNLVAPVGGTVTERFTSVNFQSSTGGEFQVATGVVRQEWDGTATFDGGGTLTLLVEHNNVASTITVQQPSLLWGFKICDLEDL